MNDTFPIQFDNGNSKRPNCGRTALPVLMYFLSFRERPLYLHVQGKNQEQVNSEYCCLVRLLFYLIGLLSYDGDSASLKPSA